LYYSRDQKEREKGKWEKICKNEWGVLTLEKAKELSKLGRGPEGSGSGPWKGGEKCPVRPGANGRDSGSEEWGTEEKNATKN